MLVSSDIDAIDRVFTERAELLRPAISVSSRKKPRAPRERRRRVLIVLTTAIAVVVALLSSFVWLASSILGSVTVLPDDQVFPQNANARPVATGAATNLLILGTDSREGIGDPSELEGGNATGQRSDTMMLLHVAADGSSATVISLMRDLWTDIPGHGEAKINAAMSWGGVPLAVSTVESLLGQRIDHVAVVDFEGFAEISTALGGVRVDSPVAFTSENMLGYSFTKGANVVQGQQALAFVRERYAFADGDYQRVRNQRSFIAGALTGLRDSAGNLDVPKLTSALQAAGSHLAVDQGLDIGTVVDLGHRLANLSASEVAAFTLPTSGTGKSPDGQSIVRVDTTQLSKVRTALADGSIVSVAAQSGWGSAER